MNSQGGFTLIEAIVSAIILGAMMAAVSPYMATLFATSRQAYTGHQQRTDQLIAQGMLQWAHDTGNGRLPVPFTGKGSNGLSYTDAPYNTTDTSTANQTLQQDLTQAGVEMMEVDDDASASHLVRVFQVVSGLQTSVPVFGLTGDSATIIYDYGVVYETACPASGSSCNPTSGSGVPGSSPAITASNYTTWDVTGTDLPPERLSTLPMQRDMLTEEVGRINMVRDHLRAYFTAMQLAAPPNSTTNYYPTPSSGATTTANASGNENCYDGWYDLTATNVLDQIGLSRTEYGVTPWGGTVEYCRDYDPTDAKGLGKPPYSIALRINRSVTQGLAPSAATAAANLFFTS